MMIEIGVFASPSSMRPPTALIPETPLWLDRIPRAPRIALAAAAIAASSFVFAALAGRHSLPVAFAELGVATAGVLLMFLTNHPSLSLLAVAGVVVIEGAWGDGAGAKQVGLALTLLAALFAGSYLRLAIGRRDTELAVAADAVGELTRRERVSRPLTGRSQRGWIASEVARAQRHGYGCALVLISPDERVDQQGLELVAGVVAEELRLSDVALREDDQVFTAVLPHTTAAGARVAAERIRLAIHSGPNAASITVSAGVAVAPADATDAAGLVRIARRALDRARSLGGNRTICASIEGGLPDGWTIQASRSQ
jgi:diguanylate cyclase (GGDEF)-like protein